MQARARPSRFVQAKAWRLVRTLDKVVADPPLQSDPDHLSAPSK